MASEPGTGTTVRLRTPAPREVRSRQWTRFAFWWLKIVTVVRQGLVALLNVVDGLEVVGEAADGVEAITQIRKQQPDITLIDLRLPRLSGVDVIQRIRMENPQARFSSC